MSSELLIKEQITEEVVKIFISGEIDIYSSLKLKDQLYQLVDVNQKDLVIDCAGLNYIDSTGLGIFVGTLKRAKQYGKTICLENLKENILKLFLITGLDKVFVIGECKNG